MVKKGRGKGKGRDNTNSNDPSTTSQQPAGKEKLGDRLRRYAQYGQNYNNQGADMSTTQRFGGAAFNAIEQSTLGRMGMLGGAISASLRTKRKDSETKGGSGVDTPTIPFQPIKGDDVVAAVNQSTSQIVNGLNSVNTTMGRGFNNLRDGIQAQSQALNSIVASNEDIGIQMRDFLEQLNRDAYDRGNNKAGAGSSSLPGMSGSQPSGNATSQNNAPGIIPNLIQDVLVGGAMSLLTKGLGKVFKGAKGLGKLGMGAIGLGGASLIDDATALGSEEVIKGTEKAGAKGAEKAGVKGAEKLGAKALSKTALKSALKKIPGIGLLMGVGFGIGRLMDGDLLGAAGEVASGAAAIIPGVGTGASLAIDAGLMAKDLSAASEESPVEDTTEIAKSSAVVPKNKSRAEAILNPSVGAASIPAAGLQGATGTSETKLKAQEATAEEAARKNITQSITVNARDFLYKADKITFDTDVLEFKFNEKKETSGEQVTTPSPVNDTFNNQTSGPNRGLGNGGNLPDSTLAAPPSPSTSRMGASMGAFSPSTTGKSELSGASGGKQAGTTASEAQKAIIREANKLGIDPTDLATVISYETGGTFNPNKMGGKGGNYMGLIQFGPNERRKYGIQPNMSFDQQMVAVGRYLQDRGLKKWLDENQTASLMEKRTALYSTINAGSPGKKYWGRSDRPGANVMSHTAEMFREGEKGQTHRGNAEAFMSGAFDTGTDATQVQPSSTGGQGLQGPDAAPSPSSTSGSGLQGPDVQSGSQTEQQSTSGGGGSVIEQQSKVAGIRKQPLSSKLKGVLQRAATAAGVDAVVFSGGQPAKGSGGRRTGSTRHDNGNAADLYLMRGGRKLSDTNSEDKAIMAKFVSAAVSAGATGVGAGHGYMGPSNIHVGFGKQATWGGASWIKSAASGVYNNQDASSAGEGQYGGAGGQGSYSEGAEDASPVSSGGGGGSMGTGMGGGNPLGTMMGALGAGNPLAGMMGALGSGGSPFGMIGNLLGGVLGSLSSSTSMRSMTSRAGPVTTNIINNSKSGSDSTGTNFPDPKNPLPAIDSMFARLFDGSSMFG